MGASHYTRDEARYYDLKMAIVTSTQKNLKFNSFQRNPWPQYFGEKKKRVFLMYFLPHRKTVNGVRYCQLLDRLREAMH